MGLTLAELHSRIDECTVCASFVSPFKKPAPGLDRGEGRDIFIIGQAPGKTEVTSGQAFSGLSGTRLNDWLIQCGRPISNPRHGVYLTSILKCPMNDHSEFRAMEKHCHHFLQSQLDIVRPKLVITLGRDSFEYMQIAEGKYDELIGQLFRPKDYSAFPHQPYTALMHWPHPSGLNRWHNIPGNVEKLRESFERVKSFLQEESQ